MDLTASELLSTQEVVPVLDAAGRRRGRRLHESCSTERRASRFPRTHGNYFSSLLRRRFNVDQSEQLKGLKETEDEYRLVFEKLCF